LSVLETKNYIIVDEKYKNVAGIIDSGKLLE